MGRIILVTGGARSGKSSHAEARVRAMPGAPVYIATSEPQDDEMRDRVARHRAARGPGWTLIEEPLDLVGALDRSDGAGPRLVDCLTLWLANHMFAERDWEPEAARLTEALLRQKSPVVLVSNEVGMGIVPENALARAFRDAQGWVNQRVAKVADEVEFVVSGLPLRVK
ncbi:bifunctional adenosylcobinamide kinase/adenosylcobinamide-phosphate guanylyltransferase [Rhodovulum sulfidophilum]|uniref:Bifunctional adenosylcobalamin biosynthesis protein n=1 Tax=Rhodovulum sulfidophilum TaxID=35806 RepID=A0A0D6B821_RHOSU|nr:bifunctional adenosylcobinamide kinase/adenosylcobinamide-phosphate guanylyltransferase [Rhodovulum sulfidophilum]MBL3559319.1 bifunctional adenosylcobinamide kinase/adenosylcobinamide-phosphate guanylyltransferase [Rhodovulum sulfidophilum]BAQ70899.1 cobinamide kinase/cobinamide phosphate guanylyltransferase [Rhodovulum sulfidophilum]